MEIKLEYLFYYIFSRLFGAYFKHRFFTMRILDESIHTSDASIEIHFDKNVYLLVR